MSKREQKEQKEQKQQKQQRRKQKITNLFWMTLTVVIAICTVVVSISTISDMFRTRSERKVVDKKIAMLEAKIAHDSIFIHNITTSPAFMEKYARETYHMQRPGETVYILEE